MQMTSLNVSLPKPLKDYIDKRVVAGGYSTPSEYICELVHADRRRHYQAKLEALLLEGLESGPGIEVNEKFWAERHRRLSEFAAKHKLR